MNSFVRELHRRRLDVAGSGYLLAAALLVWIAALVFSKLQFPNWTLPAVVILLLAGFPIFLFWHHALRPEAKPEAIEFAPPTFFLPVVTSGSIFVSILIATIAVPKSYEFMAKTKTPTDDQVEVKVKEVLWRFQHHWPRADLIPGSAKLHGAAGPGETSLGFDAATDLSVIALLNAYIQSFQPKHLINPEEFRQKKLVVDVIDLVIAKLKPDPSKSGASKEK
jgi:heme/copper-type cytochrome/quinol oxidase subunit 2